MTTPVGILGIGIHLPPAIRSNAWWPPEVVAGWAPAHAERRRALTHLLPDVPEAAQRVIAATLALGDDPFEGAVERRVLADDQDVIDMETAAARAALDQAGLEADGVDLLLTHAVVPDHLISNGASALHHRLGLPRQGLAIEVQASAYSFLAQLAVAVPMITGGRVRRALLVQSSAATRLLDPADLISPRFGDAATAVVIGPVAPGYGVVGQVHATDGSGGRTLVAGPTGARWHAGRAALHVADPQAAGRAFLGSLAQAAEAVDAVLAQTGLGRDQIDVFAPHQAAPWFPTAVRQHVGLTGARMVERFATTGYVFASSLPLILAAAVDAGALGDGDRVLALAAGAGISFGAVVLRWGGRP